MAHFVPLVLLPPYQLKVNLYLAHFITPFNLASWVNHKKGPRLKIGL